jgi:hypothetical protein
MTCKAPFIYNNETGICEMYKIIPKEHCAGNDIRKNLYTLIYNKQTKKCEYTKPNDPLPTVIEFPVCIPGTTEMPDGWCKNVIATLDPAKEFVSDGPPGPTGAEMLNKLMAKDALAEEKKATEAKKETNNILLFLFLIFIIFGAGIYFFFK